MDNGQKPATKQDLEDLRKELLAADTGLKDELLEAMHDIETHLLKAFYGYTDGVSKHLTDLDPSDGALRERFGNLENRVGELERRIHFPHFKP